LRNRARGVQIDQERQSERAGRIAPDVTMTGALDPDVTEERPAAKGVHERGDSLVARSETFDLTLDPAGRISPILAAWGPQRCRHQRARVEFEPLKTRRLGQILDDRGEQIARRERDGD
jgi:hypothetical protein